MSVHIHFFDQARFSERAACPGCFAALSGTFRNCETGHPGVPELGSVFCCGRCGAVSIIDARPPGLLILRPPLMADFERIHPQTMQALEVQVRQCRAAWAERVRSN